MNARKNIRKKKQNPGKKTMKVAVHNHHTMNAEDIYHSLRERGYRITVPRRTLVEALLSASAPKNAKEIARHTGIKELSTIYRTLSELVKENLVSELTDDGIVYYELHEHHHDHAICDSCGAILHIPCSEPIVPKVFKKSGFVPTTHEIIWRGLCSKCV